MTVQEARKELKSYRKLLDMRKERAERIEYLRAVQSRYTINKYGTVTGRNPYKMEELIDKITVAEESYVQSVADTVDRLAEIERKIEQLEGRHYEILRKKYIEGKCYEQIAVDMHYVYEYVRQLENQGVEKYARLP